MNYLDQNSLIRRIKKDNCQICLKILIDQYYPLIKKIQKDVYGTYRYIPLDFETIEVELKSIFWKLVMDYNLTSNKPFPAYIKQFLFYNINSYLRSITTQNHQILNFSQSINFEIEKLNIDVGSDYFVFTPLLLKNLSTFEREIFSLLIAEKTMKEIAEIVSKNYKTIYAMRKQIFNKIRTNFIEENK